MQGWGARQELTEWCAKDGELPANPDEAEGRQDDQQAGWHRQRRRHVEDEAVQKAALAAVVVRTHSTEGKIRPERTEHHEGQGQKEDQAEPRLQAGEQSREHLLSGDDMWLWRSAVAHLAFTPSAEMLSAPWSVFIRHISGIV